MQGIDLDEATVLIVANRGIFPGWIHMKGLNQDWHYTLVQSMDNGGFFYCEHNGQFLNIYHDFPDCPEDELSLQGVSLKCDSLSSLKMAR